MTTTITSEQFIKTSPALVYYAFTHATALHEWLCDFTTVVPRPGGRMYLWWHGDFYSAGEFISLEENISVHFKWLGRFDPDATEVLVTLTHKTEGTLVTLHHVVPDGDDWAQRALGFKSEWDSSLNNLASVLETGLDKRTLDRPLLGININDFNTEIARNLKVPVNEGIRLDDILPGFGAHSAGLCKDDVIVELDRKPISNDFGSFLSALSGKKGGDTVDVVFYRGSQKRTATMELSKRPIPVIYWDPVELSRQVRRKYDDTLNQLETCLLDVIETVADRQPGPGEWSAKQILAHLILTERVWISNLDDSVGGYERIADDWGGNIPAHINATVKAYGTTRGLLDELKRLSDELVAFLAALPDSFVERKASYFLNAAQIIEMESHTLSHINQINTALGLRT